MVNNVGKFKSIRSPNFNWIYKRHFELVIPLSHTLLYVPKTLTGKRFNTIITSKSEFAQVLYGFWTGFLRICYKKYISLNVTNMVWNFQKVSKLDILWDIQYLMIRLMWKWIILWHTRQICENWVVWKSPKSVKK